MAISMYRLASRRLQTLNGQYAKKKVWKYIWNTDIWYTDILIKSAVDSILDCKLDCTMWVVEKRRIAERRKRHSISEQEKSQL